MIPPRPSTAGPLVQEGCEAFRKAMDRAFPLQPSDEFNALLRAIDDKNRKCLD
jgi:hypothetical protein